MGKGSCGQIATAIEERSDGSLGCNPETCKILLSLSFRLFPLSGEHWKEVIDPRQFAEERKGREEEGSSVG